MKTTKTISIIRWTARIIGTLLVLFSIILVVGGMLESYNKHGVSLFDNFDIFKVLLYNIYILEDNLSKKSLNGIKPLTTLKDCKHHIAQVLSSNF